MVESDRFGIVANVINDRVLRSGAKVWIISCTGDSFYSRVIGLNKQGRQVTKYTHCKRLAKFRAAWIPMHLRDRLHYQYASKTDALERAGLLRGWDALDASLSPTN